MPPQTNYDQNDDHKELTVETMKTPPLRIQPAPIKKRIIATILDSAIIAVVWFLLTFALSQWNRLYSLVAAASVAALSFIYYVLQEGFFSVTVGKLLMGLRVVGKSGDPVSMRESLIRNLLRFVDWLPAFYLLGAVMIAISADRQRFGDMVGGTTVTLAQEKDINPPPAPFLFH